jgi:peptide/nickel transport system substrate-binding protein
MLQGTRLTREGFLKRTATAAIGMAVATATRGAGKVGAQAMSYNESPALAGSVAAGQLPPVSDRLPENPYVVSHKWLTPGNYGGTMRLAMRYSSDLDVAKRVANFMYGHSPLRWLRDGLEIGPGFAESWESNEDASTWTLNIRKGIKWSDGHPFTAEDVMFWWDDEVNAPELRENAPDETKSGRGTLARFVKLDEYTIQMQFDAPAPLTPDRLAMWVKRGIQDNTLRWMDPKHYLAQYHIRYNASLDRNTWVDTFIERRNQLLNPECPTLGAWKLESVTPGQQLTFVRNPYNYTVDQWGNQLPYLDRIVANNFQDVEVTKLQYTTGQADFVQGNQAPLTLGDIQTLRQAEARSGLELRLWDSGSGTGSLYFFNWNYREPRMRELIRNSTFRKALSHAFNRSRVQRSVYFNTGELTAGTMSPKAIEYQIPGGKGVYEEWRDSAIRYDPELAKRMLDSIGVVDRNRDGWREMPDGSPLEITLDYHSNEAANSEAIQKNELLAADWKEIGIKAELNPVPNTAWNQLWQAGRTLMRTNWEVGDGPNHLVYPQWVVPLEPERWAPLNGNWQTVRGTAKETQELEKDPYDREPPREQAEPGGPIDRLWQLHDLSKITADPMERHQIVWDMIKVHVQDGPFFSGSVANPPRPVLVKRGLKNVPQRDDLALKGFINPWIHPTPAVYDPDSWYWDNPAAHQ